MLEFNNPERAKDYLEHVLRLFGTTAMDHWTDADAFDIRNAIAIITDKDFGWSTEMPTNSCIAWKCIISRHSEHYMKAETYLADVNRFWPDMPYVRSSEEPIFRELHHLSEEEEDFWPEGDLVFYKVIEPPYTNMQALIQKVKTKEEENGQDQR